MRNLKYLWILIFIFSSCSNNDDEDWGSNTTALGATNNLLHVNIESFNFDYIFYRVDIEWSTNAPDGMVNEFQVIFGDKNFYSDSNTGRIYGGKDVDGTINDVNFDFNNFNIDPFWDLNLIIFPLSKANTTIPFQLFYKGKPLKRSTFKFYGGQIIDNYDCALKYEYNICECFNGVPDWYDLKNYQKDTYVLYQGNIYQSLFLIVDNNQTPDASPVWNKIGPFDETIIPIYENNNIIDNWIKNKIYQKNELVVFEKGVYKVLNNNTFGEDTPDKISSYSYLGEYKFCE
ncbi:hypothetical protein [Aureivirga sp. CE67]|uniref:hypothetical protein n=1 Tax=Aureivirga sp. CE67 TaxID=1788983 RepID=UPI0018C9FA9D|nr:hypothetical protein [Aureivirga sp. CE67]